MPTDLSRNFLHSLVINAAAAEELIEYDENAFDFSKIEGGIVLPLPDEAFVRDWEEYAGIAEKEGSFMALKDKLIGLNFPVEKGIGKTAGYIAAMEKGFEAVSPAAEGLKLDAPGKIRICLHQTIAGKIPVISVEERSDFKSLLSALTAKNEPLELPDSVGAFTVCGYKNMDRLAKIPPRLRIGKPPKELYQDKFILISRGFYSGVSPGEVGMEASEWIEKSVRIRIEHEAAHYVMERLLGSMRKRLLDELAADYMGMTAALGTYSARLFMKFMGIDGTHYAGKSKARIEYYREKLGDDAFEALKKLAGNAALNIEKADREWRKNGRTRFHLMFAMLRLTLGEIASGNCLSFLEKAFEMNKT